MGSGKSSVGRIIASRTGCESLDTDQMVVRAAGMPITQIFQERGEASFRDEETAALESLRGVTGRVISTGGGIILREGNVALLKELGFVAWLTATEEAIFERVSRSTKRPLMQTTNPRQTIHELLSLREPLYTAAAHFIVDTTSKTHEEVADAVISEARKSIQV